MQKFNQQLSDIADAFATFMKWGLISSGISVVLIQICIFISNLLVR
mgnify:CR=1 FL=1|jgi:hypothetical protein